jgi:hypothetical protein
MMLPLSRMLRHKKWVHTNKNKSPEARTVSTGLIEPGLYKLKKFFPFRLLTLFSKFQRLFYKTDWGCSFVAVGRKIT